MSLESFYDYNYDSKTLKMTFRILKIWKWSRIVQYLSTSAIFTEKNFPANPQKRWNDKLYLISISSSTELRWKSLHNIILSCEQKPLTPVLNCRVKEFAACSQFWTKCACAQPVLSHSLFLPLTLSTFGCHSHKWDGSMGDASRFPVKHPHFLPS